MAQQAGSFPRLDLSAIRGIVGNNPSTTAADAVGTVLSHDDVMVVCYILNAACYCEHDIDIMNTKLVEIIDEAYKNKIDFSDEAARFSRYRCIVCVTQMYRVIKACTETLSITIVNAIELEFAKMIKMQWATFENVGDQSEYTTSIGKIITDMVPFIHKHTPKPHFKSFCDSFVMYT